MDAPTKPTRRYVFAWPAIALVLCLLIVLLPFMIASIVNEVVQESDRGYFLLKPEHPSFTIAVIKIEFVDLDPNRASATARVTVLQRCAPDCSRDLRVGIAAINEPVEGSDFRIPVGRSFDIVRSQPSATETIEVPVVGAPLLYPLDTYDLRIGVMLSGRQDDDFLFSPLRGADLGDTIEIALLNRVPRTRLVEPLILQAESDRFNALVVADLQMRRPLYTALMAALLMMLVTVATMFAVIVSPLNQLALYAGANILGVWGIRAILLGNTITFVTSIDLILSGVIILLLAAIVARTLWLIEQQGGIHIARRVFIGPRSGSEQAEPIDKE